MLGNSWFKKEKPLFGLIGLGGGVGSNLVGGGPTVVEVTGGTTIDDTTHWISVFTSGQSLTIADVYCCSCPNFTNTIIRVPEQTANDGKKINNRQYRYPLPTAMSKIDFQNEGLSEVAGIVQSWETFKQRTGFKLCKHTIAIMFNDNLKVKEPNTYPSLDTRLNFEANLEKSMEENWSQRNNSFKRTALTNMELVYTLAEGLNLDEVETASVLLETKF